MLSDVKVLNLKKKSLNVNFSCGNYFVLSTCQRTLIIGFKQELLYLAKRDPQSDIYLGENAYHFLLEVICGLKSKLVGESEIVGQFREAYSQFVKHPAKNPLVLEILHKLFQDSKKIRSQFLTHVGQQSYAGIAKKLLSQTEGNKDVLVLGSGSLAADLLKVLTKRMNITICARNEDKVDALRREFPIKILPWNQKSSWIEHSKIINTIGASDQILFDNLSFHQWKKQNSSPSLFIDLGFPSVVNTSLTNNDGLYRLEDIFGKGVALDQLKNNKIALAKEEIKNLVAKRKKTFYLQNPFGWEELKFA